MVRAFRTVPHLEQHLRARARTAAGQRGPKIQTVCRSLSRVHCPRVPKCGEDCDPPVRSVRQPTVNSAYARCVEARPGEERLRPHTALPDGCFLTAEWNVKATVLIRPAIVREEEEDGVVEETQRFVRIRDVTDCGVEGLHHLAVGVARL